MSAEENKALIRRWYDEWNKGNLDGLLELHSMNFVDHNPAPDQTGDIDGLRASLETFRTGFKGAQVEILHLTAEGDKVSVLGRFRGTHNGPFMGTPPTGKRVDIATTDIWRIRDGEIVEAWHVEDIFGLLQQIGVAPTVTVSAK